MSRIKCFDCYDGETNHCDGCNLYNMSITTAAYLRAYEKQIPKKPHGIFCPTCGGHQIDQSWYVFEYCPECGQAIDWSDD